MARRTIIIGDIHGCAEELAALLDKLSFGAYDRLIAVGDLIVKGPKSREVLNRFIADERFSSVLGNHDRALLQFWRGESSTLTKAQEACRQELEAERQRYEGYLGTLPLWIDLGAHAIIHAGIRPGVPLSAQRAEDLTELRTLGADRTSRTGTAWYDVYVSHKFLFFGHWPALAPRYARSALGLDTGCVYGNRLTAFVIESGDLVSVEAARAYDPPSQPL